MKSYLRSAALGLVFGFAAICSLALAQTINSSLQLSQDARGYYGVDVNGNLVVQGNRHINSQATGGAAPTVTGAGCAVTTNSTDFNGQLTGCTASGLITFGQAYLTAPRCVVSSSATANGAMIVTGASIVSFSISPSTAGANTWNWFCGSVS